MTIAGLDGDSLQDPTPIYVSPSTETYNYITAKTNPVGGEPIECFGHSRDANVLPLTNFLRPTYRTEVINGDKIQYLRLKIGTETVSFMYDDSQQPQVGIQYDLEWTVTTVSVVKWVGTTTISTTGTSFTVTEKSHPSKTLDETGGFYAYFDEILTTHIGTDDPSTYTNYTYSVPTIKKVTVPEFYNP